MSAWPFSLLSLLMLMLALPLAAEVQEDDAPPSDQGLLRTPLEPVPLSPALSELQRELGRALFFDKRLSGDVERSCASCHALPPIGDDAEPVQEVKARRSVPLLYNVGELYWYNWDGRFARLEEVVEDAITNLEKMNAEWATVLARLEAGYGSRFARLDEQEGMSRRAVVVALAAFLRSLNAPNARLDRFLQGDQDALNEEEREGYRLFRSLGCVQCHNGRLVGGNFFERVYIYRHEDGEESEPRLRDPGRFLVTGEEIDRNLFRVPSLRNVALTAPYYHDGSIETLEEAVEEMAEHQLGIIPTEAEVRALVAFLRTLTGRHPGVTP